MKLMDRDTQIIEFISENKGATIEQIAKLYFPSYFASAHRLKTLESNEFIKSEIHPTIGKKVYFIKKLPSYHSLVINDIAIMLKGKYKSMKREYKLKKHIIDCIFILNEGKLLLIEIDIFNRTTDKKLNDIMVILAGSNIVYELWVVCKYERRSKARGVRFLRVGEEVVVE